MLGESQLLPSSDNLYNIIDCDWWLLKGYFHQLAFTLSGDEQCIDRMWVVIVLTSPITHAHLYTRISLSHTQTGTKIPHSRPCRIQCRADWNGYMQSKESMSVNLGWVFCSWLAALLSCSTVSVTPVSLPRASLNVKDTHYKTEGSSGWVFTCKHISMAITGC